MAGQAERRRGGWLLPGLLLGLVLLLSACSGEETGSSGGMVGQQAPEFTVKMLGGGETTLAGLRGRTVLLEFWAPWCPGCLKNIPEVAELHRRFGERLAIVSPSSEVGEKSLAAFVADKGITYPVALANRRLLSDYRVSGIPVTVLIDAKGVIRYHRAGQFKAGAMARTIERLLP
jgi:cytochrome c biogenesis protein CcmG, thiol:disulfide interchange protein DsbE